MGITDYYDIPYPELTDEPDGAAQMKAIADRIEVLLKNGFTMPTGSLTVGTLTGPNTYNLILQALYAPDNFEADIYLHNPSGALAMMTRKNGAEVGRLVFWQDGVVSVRFGGQFIARSRSRRGQVTSLSPSPVLLVPPLRRPTFLPVASLSHPSFPAWSMACRSTYPLSLR